MMALAVHKSLSGRANRAYPSILMPSGITLGEPSAHGGISCDALHVRADNRDTERQIVH